MLRTIFRHSLIHIRKLVNKLDCGQSLFGQSRLCSAGLERANWPRGELERAFSPASPRLSLASHSRFPSSREFALSSPAELRRDWPKRDCSQSMNKHCMRAFPTKWSLNTCVWCTTRRDGLDRNVMHSHTTRFLKSLQPAIILIENVTTPLL